MTHEQWWEWQRYVPQHDIAAYNATKNAWEVGALQVQIDASATRPEKSKGEPCGYWFEREARFVSLREAGVNFDAAEQEKLLISLYTHPAPITAAHILYTDLDKDRPEEPCVVAPFISTEIDDSRSPELKFENDTTPLDAFFKLDDAFEFERNSPIIATQEEALRALELIVSSATESKSFHLAQYQIVETFIRSASYDSAQT